MPSRLSIKDRMRRGKSLEARREIASDWASNWMRDHETTLDDAKAALQRRDLDAVARLLAQMDALHSKGFVGLSTVIAALTGDNAF